MGQRKRRTERNQWIGKVTAHSETCRQCEWRTDTSVHDGSTKRKKQRRAGPENDGKRGITIVGSSFSQKRQNPPYTAWFRFKKRRHLLLPVLNTSWWYRMHVNLIWTPLWVGKDFEVRKITSFFQSLFKKIELTHIPRISIKSLFFGHNRNSNYHVHTKQGGNYSRVWCKS